MLTISLPCPTAMTNQSKKLIILSPLIPHSTFLSISSDLIQYILHSNSKTLILIQMRRFLIVAKIKNYSNKKKYNVKMAVWHIAKMNMCLSYFDIGLLLSLLMALYPFRKSIVMAKLTSPSQKRSEHTRKP